MPRIAVVMDEHRATTRVFERGEYELSVERSTPFLREKDDGSENFGIMYGLKIVGQVVDGELDETYAGEDVRPLNCFLHTDGSIRMMKRFMMAVLGYDEEEEYDKDFGGDEEQFLFDAEKDQKIEVGSGWALPVGKHVKVTLDKEIYQDEEQQRFKNWTPAK